MTCHLCNAEKQVRSILIGAILIMRIKIVVNFLIFLDCFHLMYIGKKILSNLKLCSIRKSSKLNEAAPAEAIEWLKEFLTSSSDKSWYNFC